MYSNDALGRKMYCHGFNGKESVASGMAVGICMIMDLEFIIRG